MVNRVILIGNIGKDAETKDAAGVAVTKLSLATNESYKDNAGDWQSRTEWHNVIAWRQLAERAATLKKGDTVYVEGKLTNRKWEDSYQVTRYITEVVVSYFRILTKKTQPEEGPDWLHE